MAGGRTGPPVVCHTRPVHPTLLGRLLASTILVASCSAVPNLDFGSSGCSNARGIGPTDTTEFESDKPVLRGLVGKSPADAASIARAMGHTVVFNVQIPGYGECWCVPPPEGRVTMAWWGQHGALYLGVEGVDEGHSPDGQPLRGWGC
jgi:hypothetical protein